MKFRSREDWPPLIAIFWMILGVSWGFAHDGVRMLLCFALGYLAMIYHRLELLRGVQHERI